MRDHESEGEGEEKELIVSSFLSRLSGSVANEFTLSFLSCLSRDFQHFPVQ